MPRAIAHRAGRPIFCGLLSGLCIGQRPLANPGADRMQYAILCYNEEEVVWSMFKEDDPAMMTHLNSVQDRLVKSGKLGVSLRLLPPLHHHHHRHRHRCDDASQRAGWRDAGA